MHPISLIKTAGYLPGTPIDLSFYPIEAQENEGFLQRGKYRHHISENENAADMIINASSKLIKELNLDPAKDIDIILTNVSCPDQPFNGCGVEVKHRLGAKAKWIFDIHNTGCISFVMMMSLAQSLMASSQAKTALICCVQSAAGRIFADPQIRSRPESCVPGDGCGVGYFVANEQSPIKSIVHHSYGEYAMDMVSVSDDKRKWWQNRETAMRLDLSEDRIPKIVMRGNKIVPDVIKEACQEAGILSSNLNILITNQPNPVFLRNWREALELPKESQIETFEEHGNMFGAAIPICFEKGITEGRIKKNDYIALGGFSHAGDFAASAIIHWQAGLQTT